MLAVVEYEQRLLSFKSANEVLDRIALARKLEVECLRDGAGNVLAACQGREFDEPHAIAKAVDQIRRDLQGRARLTTPPEPVSVTSRCCCNSDIISATSSSRPTKEVSLVGKLFERWSSDRSSGNACGNSGAIS